MKLENERTRGVCGLRAAAKARRGTAAAGKRGERATAAAAVKAPSRLVCSGRCGLVSHSSDRTARTPALLQQRLCSRQRHSGEQAAMGPARGGRNGGRRGGPETEGTAKCVRVSRRLQVLLVLCLTIQRTGGERRGKEKPPPPAQGIAQGVGGTGAIKGCRGREERKENERQNGKGHSIPRAFHSRCAVVPPSLSSSRKRGAGGTAALRPGRRTPLQGAAVEGAQRQSETRGLHNPFRTK